MVCLRVAAVLPLLIAASVVTVGCQSYAAPGASADLSMFQVPPGMSEQELEEATDDQILQMLDREPLASFPVNLAVARVQEDGYRSPSRRSSTPWPIASRALPPR